jgi:trimethylamine:corrinoid methyltransferase-like protein
VASAIWKKMLAEYGPARIDEAVDQGSREWIDRQKASLPDSNVRGVWRR